MSDMDPKELRNELARLAGRVAHVEDKAEHINDEIGEIKKDVKKMLADMNEARGMGRMLWFLGLTIPPGLASLATWLMTRQ